MTRELRSDNTSVILCNTQGWMALVETIEKSLNSVLLAMGVLLKLFEMHDITSNKT